MAKVIRNDVKELKLLDYKILEIMQGNLKDLSEKNYQKLRKSIDENGFSEPIGVWFNNGKYYILSGTQRRRALEKMEAEGYVIPQIPCVVVHAQNYNEAKKKILSSASLFGRITEEGLYEFLQDMDTTLDEVHGLFDFAELDIDNFLASYYGDETDQEAASDGEETEEAVDVECPRCKLKFSV